MCIRDSLRIVAPRHDVEGCPYRGQPVGVRFIQVAVYPRAIDAVAPRIAGWLLFRRMELNNISNLYSAKRATFGLSNISGLIPVSYTHLDVYKRQHQ